MRTKSVRQFGCSNVRLSGGLGEAGRRQGPGGSGQRAQSLIGDPRAIVGGCGGNARDSFKAFQGDEVLIPGSDVVGGLR
jgi:hypothetical protein